MFTILTMKMPCSMDRYSSTLARMQSGSKAPYKMVKSDMLVVFRWKIARVTRYDKMRPLYQKPSGAFNRRNVIRTG